MNARYYDPRLGLFLQPDWFEVTEPGVGTNRYAYSFNDPVNLRDPGGNDIELLVGGAYGAHRYGHAALRVFGNGRDVTYDFGRYGATWGLGGAKGEGVLRVWTDFEKYIDNQNAKGRTTIGFVYEQSDQADEAIIGHFNSITEGADVRDGSVEGVVQYVLGSDYHGLENNCTTVSVDGISSGNPNLGSRLNNPKFSEGQGLSGFEVGLAKVLGAFSRVFMPADLGDAADDVGGFAERNSYPLEDEQE